MIAAAKHRAVLTLALGPVVYWEMAINLARSLRRWHSPEDLAIAIATDQTRSLPNDLADVAVLLLKAGELGEGFEVKLHLDRIAPAPHTLFIDADCLAYSRLDPVFDRFVGQPVSVVLERMAVDGEWFGDVAEFCRKLGVAAIPKFNGGLYYLEPGPTASSVFEKARSFSKQYDELGLVRLRGRPNDELLIAAAMALQGLELGPDDGTLMSDPQACPGKISLNILRGHRSLENPLPPSSLHRAWNPFRRQAPILVHFLGEYAHRPLYRTEQMRLRLSAAGWPDLAADLAATISVLWPGLLVKAFKTILRPPFRALFGPRSVKRTARE